MRKNDLYFCKTIMHSYSQKCQSDQQRLEFLLYLSLTYRLFLFSFISFYLLECAQIFLCRTLLLYFFFFFFLLIFKVTFTLHCFSAEKVAFLYCGHLKKKLGLEFGGRVKWSVGGGRRGKLDDLIMTTLRLVFACMSVGVTVPPAVAVF